MNVVGTVNIHQYANYQVGYDILSTSNEQGYHDIRCYGVLNVTGTYIAWDSGTARILDNTVGIGTYYGNGSYTLISKDVRVYADSQGKCQFYIDGSIDTSFVSGSTGGTAYLPDIPRYPILNSGTDFKDTENPVYDITAYGNFDIKVKLEAGGNTELITRILSSKDSQIYTLVLTNEERNTLRNMMTGNSLDVTETVCALNNGQEISWSYKYYKMTKGNHVNLRVNGVWKDAVPYVRINGAWKEAVPYIRINNTWKEGI